jgi:translation initiation factor 5B
LVKADTIGSLEALVGELRAMEIPVREALVGDISRRDVVQAAAMTDPLYRVLLGFNVKTLPDVEREAAENELPVFVDKVIYSLVEDYKDWLDKTRAALDAKTREERVHPAKVRFLPGCSFRQRDPAVFGVRILAGALYAGRALIRADGKNIGRIRSIQKQNQTVAKAKLGDEVALSVHGPTLGRQIKEGDVLYMDMPASDAKWLWHEGQKRMSTEERETLEQLMKIKRAGGDRFWGM